MRPYGRMRIQFLERSSRSKEAKKEVLRDRQGKLRHKGETRDHKLFFGVLKSAFPTKGLKPMNRRKRFQ